MRLGEGRQLRKEENGQKERLLVNDKMNQEEKRKKDPIGPVKG